jgi:prolyl oligopeptidase
MTTDVTFPDRTATDEWIWLEEIYGDDALEWVNEQNEKTLAALDQSALKKTSSRILEVLDSNDRIPMVARHGDFLYNFWRDSEHPRGLWRRTTMDSYRKSSPEWDVLLDVDELAREEDTEWVFAGANMLPPDNTRALLRLSPDGGDAVVVREFDLEGRTFVENGFSLPLAKCQVAWVDRDTVLVSTDFGPGSLTTSSYPRQARRWRRGTPLASAEPIMEIPEDHMALWVGTDLTEGFKREYLVERIGFFTGKTYLLQNGQPVLVDVPIDTDVSFHREWLLLEPRSDWTIEGVTYPAGSLLAADADAWLKGERNVAVLFSPDEHTSLVNVDATRNHILITELRDVASRVEVVTPGPDGWNRSELGVVGPNQTIGVAAVDADENDDFWMVVSGFLTPPTLQLGTVGSDKVETLKTSPSYFDEARFKVSQHFTTSQDGTRVPYFQIAPRDMSLDGSHPTLLRGYGGFQIPQVPQYDGTFGRAWLEQGGVMIVANIRGGGEYGPAWHQAAMRENRHRAYEDFAAVARDVIDRKVTSPKHLGCMGGSNGGLLVGNMLTHYPELFGAIVCQVPLLDMQRYTKLSAGYSWIAEYGDPDVPEDWAFIQTFSPYHNLREGVDYPSVLFYAATSDDRVGPVQARKMAARMQQRGIPGVLFYENRQGGHAGSADNAQRAHMVAMSTEFLRDNLTK